MFELCDGLFISETLSLQSAGRQIVDEGLLKSTRLAVNIRVLFSVHFNNNSEYYLKKQGDYLK